MEEVVACNMDNDDTKALQGETSANHDQNDVKTKEPDKKHRFLKFKIAKQITLICVWAALGLFLEVIGPTLTDLKNNINVNYEEISRTLLAKSGGVLLGSIFGGILHERFYSKSDLIMAIGIFVGAVGITLSPLMPNLTLLGLMLLLTGVSEGFINTGGNTMVLHLWGKKAAAPMCSLHLGFGIGAMLIPQVAAPFLSEATEDNATSTSVYVNSFQNTTAPLYVMATSSAPDAIGSNMTQHSGIPRLAVPYAVAGFFATLTAIAMLIFFIVGPPKGYPRRKGTKESKKLCHPGQCGYGNSCYGLMVLFLLFVYYIQAAGGERAYGKYIASYSLQNEVKFSKQKSANLASVFWFSHMSGRLTGALVSYWVPVSVSMLFFMSVATASAVVLSVWGNDTALVLWIFTGFMGFAISLGFPLGMSWGNLHLQMNSVAVMVLLMGTSVGGFIYHYLPGYLLEYVGPRTLMYVMVAYGILLLFNFAIMEFVARKIGNKVKRTYDNKKLDVEEKELEIMVKTQPADT